MLKNLCDTHTHTIFSRHAYSTIEEDVRAASERGLELIGVTDHYSQMVATGRSLIEYQHFCNMKGWPRTWYGVEIMRGAEADIVDLDGHLFGHDTVCERSLVEDPMKPRTLDDMALWQADYVIASIHGKHFCDGASVAQTTAMYVAALEDPRVVMVGHIVRAGVPVDFDAVLDAAKDLDKMIEINNHTFSMKPEKADGCREIAIRCAEKGVKIAVNTDAHISYEVGRFDEALAMLDGIGFPQELVATTDAATFKAAVAAARKL
jgi:putative hydrolase